MSKAPETIYDIREAREEIVRLRALLKEYARHKSDCQRYGRLQCTCGFTETMARDALTKEG